MSAINLLLLIVNRDDDEDYADQIRMSGVRNILSCPCVGTAGQRVLDMLGLQKTEKTLLLAAIPREECRNVLDRCIAEMGLNLPGSGIAMTVPMDSAGGKSSLDYLMEGQKYTPGKGGTPMDERTMHYSLVMAIAESGHSDEVMDAARAAGAGGGTVIHSKGTAGSLAEKFLGLSLATEKEMILIVLARKQRNAVMKAIMDKAGISTPAHTVLFSLPVEDVAGLKSVIEAAAEEEE